MNEPAAIKRKTDGPRKLEVKLRFITPMFGGGTYTNPAGHGSQHKDYDHETPVRGSALRGQLRFWWRATTGAWCASLKEMREREDAIFGNASVPGDVSIWVRSADLRVTSMAVFETYRTLTGRDGVRAISASSGLAYGAFSLNPVDAEPEKTLGDLHVVTGSWVTALSCSSSNFDDVKLAISAFVAFGGLGGRTTRGFGQVAVDGGNGGLLSAAQVLQEIGDKGDATLKDAVPAIDPDAVVQFRPGGTGETALNRALNLLRTFRQGKEVGRNRGQQHKRPGRSRWPEPDAIRVITNQHSNLHRPDPTYSTVRKFPRAAFGMPIIFHFKDGGDPRDQSLQPVGKERMRSPLQIAVDDKGTVTFLVLTAPRPGNVELKGTGKVDWELKQDDTQLLRRRGPDVFTNPDPLQAFLNYVRAQKG